jgi:hypothetical protein
MKKHNEKPEFDAEGYQLAMNDLNGEALPNPASLKFKPLPRGGARPGAGRKPSGREPIMLRLRPAIARRLRAAAKKQGKTLSEVAEARLAKI